MKTLTVEQARKLRDVRQRLREGSKAARLFNELLNVLNVLCPHREEPYPPDCPVCALYTELAYMLPVNMGNAFENFRGNVDFYLERGPHPSARD